MAITTTRADVAAALVAEDAAIVLDLATGRVATVGADVDPFTVPDWMVLVTTAELLHLSREAKGDLGRLTRIVNLDLAARVAAGEVPTLEAHRAAVAEITQFEQEAV